MRTSSPPTLPTPPTRARRRQRARWLLWRCRFLIAAAAAACAITLVLNEFRQPLPPTQAVVALRSDIVAGAAITARDVQLVNLPTQLIPDDAYTQISDVTGRATALPLGTNTVLSGGLIAGGAAQERAPAGKVIVPVRLSDATITTFVNVGDHVDLVLVPDNHGRGDPLAEPTTIDTGEITTLAQRALILPAPEPEEAESSGLLGAPSSPDDSDAFLLVAVSPQEAKTLTAAAKSGYIGAVLVE